MLFSKIYGAGEVKKSLVKAIQNNHVAHAQLFYGLEGSPNLAMALAFATFINCENKSSTDSCGTCPSCQKMTKLIHPDVHFVYPAYKKASKEQDKHKSELAIRWRANVIENPYRNLSEWSHQIDAENKQCIISVDDAREIVKGVSLKAFEGEYKIIIIWLPELMNVSAANSILKVLEEPPQKTLFLLVTNDLNKNLTTILSRCQVVQVPKSEDEDTVQFLTDTFQISNEEAQRIALLCEGNLNQASKMAQDTGGAERDYFKNWMRMCYAVNYAALIKLADEFSKKSKEFQKGLMLEGINIMRSLLMYHVELNSLMRIPEDEKEFVQKFSKIVTEEKLDDISAMLDDAFYHLERNANAKITFFDLSLNLAKTLRG